MFCFYIVYFFFLYDGPVALLLEINVIVIVDIIVIDSVDPRSGSIFCVDCDWINKARMKMHENYPRAFYPLFIT